MHLISVIVPVYNVEKYISECIESVIRQSYTEWELLLINDGSTDSSGLICDDFANKDNRIKVTHKPNTGVSDTKNRGLDIAQGNYIIFLDADDYWVKSTILEELLFEAENKQLDIVRGEYKCVDATGNDIQKSPYILERTPYISQKINSFSFLSNVVRGEYFLVLCLIKRSAIEHIRFNTQRIFLEDAEFYLNMLQQPLKCSYIPTCFYAYRKHSDSVTVAAHPKKFFDALDYTHLCFELSRQENNTREHTLFLIKEGVKNYLFDIRVISETDRTNKEYNEVIKKYNLHTRRLEVTRHALQYPISLKCYMCLFPLKVLIYYYRILYDTKRFLKHIYHRIQGK